MLVHSNVSDHEQPIEDVPTHQNEDVSLVELLPPPSRAGQIPIVHVDNDIDDEEREDEDESESEKDDDVRDDDSYDEVVGMDDDLEFN